MNIKSSKLIDNSWSNKIIIDDDRALLTKNDINEKRGKSNKPKL